MKASHWFGACLKTLFFFFLFSSEWNHKKWSDGGSGQRTDIEGRVLRQKRPLPSHPTPTHPPPSILTGLHVGPVRWRTSTDPITISSFTLVTNSNRNISTRLLCLLWKFSSDEQFHLTRTSTASRSFSKPMTHNRGMRLIVVIFFSGWCLDSVRD